ncbi:MAG: hypothetical protein GY811_09825 [Myxococcales bacterium]|nr:hypothetical protein [Myxococcales bacterium]
MKTTLKHINSVEGLTLYRRAECQVGGEVFADESVILGGLKRLKPGQSKKTAINFFYLEPLDAEPEWCTVSFWLQKTLEKEKQGFYSMCFDGEQTLPWTTCQDALTSP